MGLGAPKPIATHHRFHIVHDGVGFGLIFERRRAPVLALVISVPLGRKVVGLNQLFTQTHHLEALRAEPQDDGSE